MDAAIEELLAPLSEARRAHSLEVGRKVDAVAHLLPATLHDVAVTAACLHDIGHGHPVTGHHALDGAKYLAAQGFSQSVCHVVAYHCASTVEAEVRGIHWSVYDAFAPPPEQPHVDLVNDVVWWADMTTGPNGETCTIDERIIEIRSRYSPVSVVYTTIVRAEPLLRAAVSRVGDALCGAPMRLPAVTYSSLS